MNILINFLFKEASGPVFSLEMARGLALNGCDVYAVLSSKISNRKDWEKEPLLKGICFIETGTRKTAISETVKFLTYKKHEIRRFFAGITFDYIIQTFYHPWAEFVGKEVAYKKIVTLCHDPVLHSGVKKTEVFLTRRFVRNSDEIVVLTKSFIPLVERNYGFAPEHIHYMPHGRMGDYRVNQKKAQVSFYDTSKTNFLFFGRISKYKGLHVLAEAFAKLEKENGNVSLTVAGSGDFSEYEDEFQAIRCVNVVNRYIQDEEVGNFFDDPSVMLVLPYLDATQSGVTPIALEYGVPIIASDSGGLKEQLDEGRIGAYVKPGDPEALYRKMKETAGNLEWFALQRRKMEQYLRQLQWDVVTKKLLDSLLK